jgi:hypothetical protein
LIFFTFTSPERPFEVISPGEIRECLMDIAVIFSAMMGDQEMARSGNFWK